MEINISGNGKFNISKVSVDSEVTITKNAVREYEDLKLTGKKKLLGYVSAFFSVIFKYIIQLIAPDPDVKLVQLAEPLTEQYILPVEEGKTYNLTYNEAYFEPIYHKYHYPFMALNGVKLKAKYTYNLEDIKYGFQFAKMYYFVAVCPVAILIGLLIGSKFETIFAWILAIGICVVLPMVFINKKVEGYKKKLLEELVKLDEGEVL